MTRGVRLGVDGRELRPGVRTGIRRYLTEMLRAASRAGWSCVVYGDASTVVDEALPGVATRVLPGRCTQVWDQVRLPRALREDGATVFLSPYYHIEARFFVPVLPFLLPFVAAGALWVAGALVVGLAALPGALRPVLRPDPGAGLYREAARWVAATQPVAAQAHFTGWRDDVPERMALGDLFDLPSLGEHFGCVLIEAMAMAKAVVATGAGGVPEIVVHGETMFSQAGHAVAVERVYREVIRVS